MKKIFVDDELPHSLDSRKVFRALEALGCVSYFIPARASRAIDGRIYSTPRTLCITAPDELSEQTVLGVLKDCKRDRKNKWRGFLARYLSVFRGKP